MLSKSPTEPVRRSSARTWSVAGLWVSRVVRELLLDREGRNRPGLQATPLVESPAAIRRAGGVAGKSAEIFSGIEANLLSVANL